jgi:hypothetical protein
VDVKEKLSPCCQVCGAEKSTDGTEFQVFSTCCSLIGIFKNDPALLEKVTAYIHEISSSSGNSGGIKAADPELPDVLDGKRYRTIDRDHNKWYLSVSEVNGQPVEVFASTAFDRDHELQSRISNLTTITRLISLILRHVVLGESLTMEKCLKQIKRSSRNKSDLPDMLYRVLYRYTKTT